MLKSIKLFMNIPIVSLSSGRRIGSVVDFIIEPSSGVIAGVVGLKYGFLKRKSRVISDTDIRELSLKGLVVDSEDVLVDQAEILEIDQILKSGIKVIGSKVYNKKGKYLGRVFDFLIDDFFQVNKIYIYPPVYNILENQIIISRNRILEIKKGAIIIDDENVEKVNEPEKIGAIS